jgi:hypothetical protein
MSDPEEDLPGQSAPKVHVQIGRFRPVSDRYPHRVTDLSYRALLQLGGLGLLLGHQTFKPPVEA